MYALRYYISTIKNTLLKQYDQFAKQQYRKKLQLGFPSIHENL